MSTFAGPRSADPVSWADLNSLSDELLVARLLAGNHDSLTVLFDRYHRLVFSIAIRIVRDEGEAEEVVQTVFLDIFQAAANFDPAKGTLKVWLLQYAYHRAMNRRRALSAQRIYSWDELDASHERAQMPGIEAIRLCQQILMQLKPLQREVLELTYFEGLTAQEIAVRQHRSAAIVRHDLYRALAKLRRSLEPAKGKREPRAVVAEKVRNHIVDARTV